MSCEADMAVAGGAEERGRGRVVRGWVERLTGTGKRWWLLVGALLGMGLAPCPECGGPMIVHTWPMAGLVVAVQTLRRRQRKRGAGGEERADDDE